MHGGSDSFGDLALEGGVQRPQVQVAVDAAELLAGLDPPGLSLLTTTRAASTSCRADAVAEDGEGRPDLTEDAAHLIAVGPHEENLWHFPTGTSVDGKVHVIDVGRSFTLAPPR